MNFLISKKDIDTLRRLNFRQIIWQLVVSSHSIIHTYMIWKTLCYFLKNASPFVCVLSGSMEPGFQRGDILLLMPRPYRAGDICVYQVAGDAIPIVHRAIKVDSGRILTKGDNNRNNDIPLYRRGRTYLEQNETRAGAYGLIPYFGIVTVWITSIPGLRMIILTLIGLSVFITRQEG